MEGQYEAARLWRNLHLWIPMEGHGCFLLSLCFYGSLRIRWCKPGVQQLRTMDHGLMASCPSIGFLFLLACINIDDCICQMYVRADRTTRLGNCAPTSTINGRRLGWMGCNPGRQTDTQRDRQAYKPKRRILPRSKAQIQIQIHGCYFPLCNDNLG
ncbi:hypothetical protein GQ53DRAFT_182626 [Thozetella sp. PMI_491]|nr:hypothetical protein GQ53DRAFT_182626 [Thozetella sp. PMI_491]